MEDGTDNSKTEIDVTHASGITEILNEILDSSVSESFPSTSKSDSISRVVSIIPLETTSVPSDDSSDPNLQQEDSSNEDGTNSNNDKDKAKENVPFVTCTVKEILNEILDCTVIRRPSIILPPTSHSSEGNLVEPTLEPLSDFILDPKLIPRHLYGTRTTSDESTHSRMQYTAKEVLNEILDYTVFKKTINTHSCRSGNANDSNKPGTSLPTPEYTPQGEYGKNQRDYQIYRAMGCNLIRSASAPQRETFFQKPSAKSLGKILPSYSTVIKLGPPPKIKSFHSSGSFIPRQPPPSYAEVEGLWEDSPSMISSESAVFGPDPAYMVCPRCRIVVVTEVQTERSNMAHLIALVMCLFLCWPCCLLPYCLRSCSYSYHSCPNCGHYFGMYRPF